MSGRVAGAAMEGTDYLRVNVGGREEGEEGISQRLACALVEVEEWEG